MMPRVGAAARGPSMEPPWWTMKVMQRNHDEDVDDDDDGDYDGDDDADDVGDDDDDDGGDDDDDLVDHEGDAEDAHHDQGEVDGGEVPLEYPGLPLLHVDGGVGNDDDDDDDDDDNDDDDDYYDDDDDDDDLHVDGGVGVLPKHRLMQLGVLQ